MTAKEDAKEKEEGDEEEEEAASNPEKVEEKVEKTEDKEKNRLKVKPQQLFNEFVPSTHSSVTFSLPPPALVQQPGPQQSYQPYTQ